MAKETWQNVTRGTAAILKLDVRGMEYGEVIPSGMKTSLTPEERRLNQDRAASQKQDLFSNGTLAPVRLIPDAEDYTEIASNPNFMSEEEIKDLFKLTLAKLRERLETIESVALINRICEVAEEIDAKKSQLDACQARLSDFKPKNVIEVASIPPGSTAMRPGTPL